MKQLNLTNPSPNRVAPLANLSSIVHDIRLTKGLQEIES